MSDKRIKDHAELVRALSDIRGKMDEADPSLREDFAYITDYYGKKIETLNDEIKWMKRIISLVKNCASAIVAGTELKHNS